MTLQVLIVRHAIAFERDRARWPDDRERPLTEEGARRFRKAARGLERLVDPPERVLASPLARAWQTAQILEADAGWPTPEECVALEPGQPAAQVLRALRDAKAARLACVGHEPDLSGLIAECVSGAEDVSVEMKKGAVACVEFPRSPETGEGTLAWLAPPRLLRRVR